MEVYTARLRPGALPEVTQVWPDLVLMRPHDARHGRGEEATAASGRWEGRTPTSPWCPLWPLTANAMKGVREEFLQRGSTTSSPSPSSWTSWTTSCGPGSPRTSRRPPPRPGDLVAEPIPEDLQRLPGIDVARGMSYCGTGQVYRKTLFLFRGADPPPPAADPQGPGDRAVGGLRHRGPQPEERRPVDRRHGPGGPGRGPGDGRPGGGPGEDRRRHPGTPPPVPGPGGDLGLPEGAGITPPVSQSAPQPARSFPARKGKGLGREVFHIPARSRPIPAPP